MKSLAVIANLGTLRAFRTRDHDEGEQEHLEEIGVPEPPRPPEPMHEMVSDQAGRFPSGMESDTPSGMAHGEKHNKISEERRRHIRALAAKIEQIVRDEALELWRLAAPSEINSRIVALLSENVRARLILNLHADLTHLSMVDLEKRLIGMRDGERRFS